MRPIPAVLACAGALAAFRPASAEAFRQLTQGEQRFEAWQDQGRGRAAEVSAFDAFLARNGVDAILPTYQLLRTDERWPTCGPPFALPPRSDWPRMVPTLKLIRDKVVPAVGPVEVVAGYREPALNKCIGGSKGSAHLRFGALDLRPVRKTPLATLAKKMCAVQAASGRSRHMGLGLYREPRFHVDTAGFRTWGHDYTGKTSPCRR